MRKVRVAKAVVLLACIVLTRAFVACAQERKVDLNALVQETQKRSDAVGEMTFVWWIPEEYWRGSFAQNPSVTPEQTENVLAVFRPYTLVAVVDGKMGSFGGVTYKTEVEIRSIIQLKDKAGTLYQPLADELVTVDTKSFLAAMKPVLSSVLGPMGANMYFYLFAAKDKDGAPVADARKDGSFSVMLGQREFRWNLPLASLIPAKVCPTCKRQLSGAYKYCPYDGTKLE